MQRRWCTANSPTTYSPECKLKLIVGAAKASWQIVPQYSWKYANGDWDQQAVHHLGARLFG